ncbi:substrate-binding domain-containing protein [Actinokineospora soli]|uniref:Substrate-binding domain-containing protein n=1 Tax=Actinokineospora soli TaxID=1048753 RepID=A0ABW2TVW2_9PSEU
MTAAADRLTGYHRSLSRAGRDAGPVAFGDFTRTSGESAMRTLLDRDPDIDAVFAANDMMAIGALRTLRAAGRRVPEDVSVVGYDDIELTQHTDPALTTVRQPVVDQARTMTELLLLQIGGHPRATRWSSRRNWWTATRSDHPRERATRRPRAHHRVQHPRLGLRPPYKEVVRWRRALIPSRWTPRGTADHEWMKSATSTPGPAGPPLTTP